MSCCQNMITSLTFLSLSLSLSTFVSLYPFRNIQNSSASKLVQTERDLRASARKLNNLQDDLNENKLKFARLLATGGNASDAAALIAGSSGLGRAGTPGGEDSPSEFSNWIYLDVRGFLDLHDR